MISSRRADTGNDSGKVIRREVWEETSDTGTPDYPSPGLSFAHN